MTSDENSQFADLMDQIESLKQQIDDAEKPKEQAFEVGDVVRLKSGGENMTVIAVDATLSLIGLAQHSRERFGWLILSWQRGGSVSQATLPVKAVERVGSYMYERISKELEGKRIVQCDVRTDHQIAGYRTMTVQYDHSDEVK